VFDVTLDCEDGAPVGGEAEHAALVASLALGAAPGARVAARVHAPDHPAFEADLATIAGQAGHKLCHLMIPKVESVADVQRAQAALAALGGAAANLPLHVLVESPRALHNAYELAAHPRVQSISFGLMDFVSSHNGAIPAEAMSSEGQFSHPLVLRAKLEIAAACHAHGKVPSHCVITELNDSGALVGAVRRASRELGFTRAWSIHPSQIRTILAAFAPSAAAIDEAAELICAADLAGWAPLALHGRLHDRASYRYYWQVLERAHGTGMPLPSAAQGYFLKHVGGYAQ
jgi:citrate lyase subunit beta/citryl-CoA lyase